jgi:hypothetical protein
MKEIDSTEVCQTSMITGDCDFRGEYEIPGIPNQRLGIPETVQQASQAHQQGGWSPFERIESAGFEK